MNKVDIIIPTVFNPNLTYGLLDSFKKFNIGTEYLITIVDNGSNPEFEYNDDKINIIKFKDRLGFSQAMNEGIKATKNDYVLLCNNDTLIQHDNFLSNLLQTMESEEKVGIVSPCTNYICIENAKCKDVNSRDNRIINQGGHIAAVCWLIKRSTLLDIGVFDENLKNSHQDGDLSERILRAGYKIMIDRRSFIFHYGSRSVSQTPGYYEEFQRNSNYSILKWKNK